MQKPKYSIIIPTFNHCEDLLKPCIGSIIANTIMSEVEVIIVSNGSTDNTVPYVKSLDSQIFKLIDYPEPLGYTKSTNLGIKSAQGEFVVLLNNDCVILDYLPASAWLKILEEPMENPKIGISGPSSLWNSETESHFIIFFCAMIRRQLFSELGFLDESFSPGIGEDIDFCVKAKMAGWDIFKVPDNNLDWHYVTTFPIYHKAEGTILDGREDEKWHNTYKRNMNLLKERKQNGYYK